MKKSKILKIIGVIFVLMVTFVVVPSGSMETFAYSQAPRIVSGSIYYIKNKNSGRYLDVENGRKCNGANVNQWNFNGTDAQKWKVVHVGNGIYKIVSQFGGRVLDITDGGNKNKTNIDIWSDANKSDRRFRIILNSDGYSYRIASQCSSYKKVVTVKDGSCKNRGNVFQYQYNGSKNDEWIFEPASRYDINLTLNYAKKNFNKIVPTYPDMNLLGGDCANFVSQCLLAGGSKHFQGDWWIYKKNNSNPKPASTSRLDASWSLADPSPWISAKQFNRFWAGKLKTITVKGSDIVDNPKKIFNKSYYKGDVVQILNNTFFGDAGNAMHTMLITGYGKNDFLLTYHSDNNYNKSLLQIAKENKSKYFRFFDFT